MSADLDAIVVGAGHNGLVAAAYLARAGARVVVFERRPVVGGAAVTEAVWPGYRVSVGSYVCSLLDPAIVAELDLVRHGYHAYRKDPASFTPLDDGGSLLLGSDDAQNAREIAQFSTRDVSGFHAFSTQAEAAGAALFEHFADAAPRYDDLPADVRARCDAPVADWVEAFVETPVLAATLATDGLIGTGAGPRDPGTGYVLAHHYAGRALGVQGAWGFVRGGMGAISEALASAARAAGAEIRTSSEVAAIRADADGWTVETTTGASLRARRVLSNADPRTTFLRLADRESLDPAFVAAIDRWPTRGVSLKLNLALGELPNFLARPGTTLQPHHRATIHVAPSVDYLQQAHDDARAFGASREPMLECFLQTPTDPALAPAGKHILSIFAQYFPYDRIDGPWTGAHRREARDAIVALLARYAPNIPHAIEHEQLLAPPDIEALFGIDGGNIFHGELLPGSIFEDRPGVRTPLPGVYLCGSGTHPGGCVSGFPGRRAAAAVIADLYDSQTAHSFA